MRAQPRQSQVSDKVVARATPIRRELYRELCQDEDGNRHTFVVYRPFPDISVTRYQLEDGTPVRIVEDYLFEIEPTGRTLNRCP